MTFDPEELKARIAASPYHVWSGISLVEVSEGHVVMRMQMQPHHLNPQGIVHGGVIAGLLDSVCGLSLRTVLPEDVTHRTVQLNINYMRAAKTGDAVTAVGRAVKEGRTVGYSEGEVLDARGRTVARATGTFVNIPILAATRGA